MLCTSALAQDVTPPAPPEPPPAPEARPDPGIDPLARALDLDQDKAISAEEVKKAPASLLGLDKNKDGKLTREEFAPPRGGSPLAALDRDGDGKVSKDEAAGRMKERFDEIDTNKDGFLTPEEMEARRPERREGGGPPEGEKPEGEQPEMPGRGRGFRGPGMGPGMRGAPGSPILFALDANRDGAIDAEEIKSAATALAKLDRNKDGRIAGDELAPPRGPAGFLARFDTNGDGKLSKDEAPERMKERFGEMDTNGDGFIDDKEMEAMRQRWGGEGRRGRGRDDGGDGDK